MFAPVLAGWTPIAGLEPFLGPAAGVTASLLWTCTAMCFTAAGKRIGPTTVNATRIVLAVIWLGLTHRLLTGLWIPQANSGQVLLLALSGLVGLSIGDLALFTAFVEIGPRLSMLIMTTAPLLAAAFGWLALRETLTALSGLGTALTVSGVAWVILERPGAGGPGVGSNRLRGLVLATLAAACQAGGLLLSKAGIGHGWLPRQEHLDPQAATLVRMFFAAIFVLPTLAWTAARRRADDLHGSPSITGSRRRSGYLLTLCGSIVGPFLGIWMSLVASDRAPLAVAQTACSLTPIFLLPLSAWVHKERISYRAVLGALIAVGGTALLFVRPG